MALSPRHEHAGRPLPAHPYRDAVLFHGILAVVIVVISAFSGSGLARGAAIAIAYFAAATTWSWWRFHQRIRQRAAAEASGPEESGR